MVITFVSNYINHHQLPFCEAMNSYGHGVEFYFIQTMPMEEKRRSMGWDVDIKAHPYVILGYEEKERASDLILNSDVALLGWTEGHMRDVQEKRLESSRLTFRVSERIYREGQYKAISPRGLMNKYREHIRYRNYPVYLLCTGAYVASDFNLIKSYPDKMLKWGYFPDTGRRKLQKNKDLFCVRICWAGRLIELKHPEFAVKAAAELDKKGYDFNMDIIGDGPLKGKLEEMVCQNNLGSRVNIAGSKRPSEVAEYMEKADIFLFTSNYLEGWGAVVNEAMESGCALVASAEAGAVPFLIIDGKNGLSYKNGSYDDMLKKLIYLFENKEKIREFGIEAKQTIDNVWNAGNAASKLLRFCREFLDNGNPRPEKEGPISKAEIIKAPCFTRTLSEKNHLE